MILVGLLSIIQIDSVLIGLECNWYLDVPSVDKGRNRPSELERKIGWIPVFNNIFLRCFSSKSIRKYTIQLFFLSKLLIDMLPNIYSISLQYYWYKCSMQLICLKILVLGKILGKNPCISELAKKPLLLSNYFYMGRNETYSYYILLFWKKKNPVRKVIQIYFIIFFYFDKIFFDKVEMINDFLFAVI